MAAKPKTGRLTVNLIEVQKLFNTFTMGAQDPYVKIECGPELKYKSKVVKDGGSRATFDQSFLFDLKGNELSLTFEVWASKTLGDDPIGKIVIPLVQFMSKKVEPVWVRLSRGSNDAFAGELKFSSEFVDDDKTADAKEQAQEQMVAQLNAQLAYFQALLGQKFRDADAEAKAYEQKISELNAKIAEQKDTIEKMSAIITSLRAGEEAKASQLHSKAEQLQKLEQQIEAIRPAPIVESYFENQRYAPVVGWKAPYLPYDPKPFTDIHGAERTRNMIALPQGWEWEGDWTVDTKSRPVDASGWEYSLEFLGSGTWKPHNTASDTVRRRRWIRTRVMSSFLGSPASAAAKK